jgi:hypothetical protein
MHLDSKMIFQFVKRKLENKACLLKKNCTCDCKLLNINELFYLIKINLGFYSTTSFLSFLHFEGKFQITFLISPYISVMLSQNSSFTVY